MIEHYKRVPLFLLIPEIDAMTYRRQMQCSILKIGTVKEMYIQNPGCQKQGEPGIFHFSSEQ